MGPYEPRPEKRSSGQPNSSMQHEALLLLVVPPDNNTTEPLLAEIRKNYPFIHPSECEILVKFVTAGNIYDSLRALISDADPNSSDSSDKSVYWSVLCDATESFLADYINEVAKIEREVLAEVEPPLISKIWVDVYPQVETLEILLQFLQEVRTNLNVPLILENHNEDGSALSLSGSAAILQRVYDAAIRSAGSRARPMFALAAAVHQMLFSHIQSWMREGRVPLGGEDLFPSISVPPEVSSPPSVHPAGQLPPYLPKSLREKVLFIGRARIILRQKRGEDLVPAADPVPNNVWQRLYRALVNQRAIFSIVEVEELIDELHRDSASQLWARLSELQFLRHLDALYRFALTGKGDLWTLFIEGAASALSAVPRPLNINKELEGILHRTAAATGLPEEDEWLAHVRLTWQAPALPEAHVSTAIQFDYQVEQPLDVLLNDEAMQSYRRAFANIMRIRWQQQELLTAWQLLTRFCKRTRKIPEPVQYACRLRNKIAGFVDTLLQHVQVEVVEVQYRKLRAVLAECSDFASAQRAHVAFLTALGSNTPTSHARIQPPVDALLQLAHVFCVALQSIAAPSPTIDLQHLKKVEREFDRHFGLLYALLSRMPSAWAVLLSGKMYNSTRFLQAGLLPGAEEK